LYVVLPLSCVAFARFLCHGEREPKMNDAVLVTGIGVVSPLGNSAHELAAAVTAGDSALAPLAGFDGVYGATVGDGALDAIPEQVRARGGRLDRLCRLFLSAAYRAIADARLDISLMDAERVGVSFGTGLGCLLTNAEYNQKLIRGGPAAASPRLFASTVSSAAAGEVSIALGIKGPNVTAHQGFAAGLGAIGYAADLIHTGKADVVVAGGADALGDALVQGLADMGLLRRAPATAPFVGHAPGIYPSEGAALLVLERAAHAHARGVRPRGERCWTRVDGYAAGFEPTLTHRERQPTALVETMRRALTRSGHAPADVDLVVSSAHATAVDETEGAALATVFAGGPLPTMLAPKAAWGECFAAHGALSVALAAALLRRRVTITGDAAVSKPEPNPRTPFPAREGGTAALASLPVSGRDQGRGSPVRGPASLAMVHALCYSGPTVALLLAREE
jgi:3-oxoacyl-[acyl-carrier-protein] synthase II